jgi:DNA-binding NarL/FixJ family response regulator
MSEQTKLFIQIDDEVREMNPEEQANFIAEQESLNLDLQSKVEARQSALAKLAALGLTEEEIAAL